MNIIFRLGTTLLLLLAATSAAIAGKISGKIIDEDGDVLAFASVIVKGTTIGTSANAQGIYTLNLPEGKYQLVAQYIGYKQSFFSINIGANETIEHNFTLSIQGYDLKDVVVKSNGEDPAYRIIRNAIKKRQVHLNQLQSFQTGIYMKGVLRNRNTPEKIMGIRIKDEEKKDMNGSMGLDSAGKGVIYLCEEIADYYTKGNKNKLIIRSVKESGNPNGVGMGNVPSIINFYENNVSIVGSFVSPVSQTALNYYSYKLLGNFRENDKTIYKIKLTPKRAFERCFMGDIYIVEDDWAIHSIQVLITQKQGLDMLDTMKVEQQYIPMGKDLWVIKNQVYYPTMNFLGFDLSGNFVTVYNNQKVNEAIPDSIFNKKITIAYQREANKRDSAYWKTERPIALEMDEMRNYGYKDSLHVIETDPKRMDTLRRKANKVRFSEIFVFGTSFNSKAYKSKFSISPLLFDFNFNTVEGLNYAPTLSFTHKLDTGKTITAIANLRYGFVNTHFNTKINLSYTSENRYWSGRNWNIAIAGGKYISQFNQEQPVEELLNTYASIFQQENFFKIYERYLGAIRLKRNYGNGLNWSLSAKYEKRIPLENTTDFSATGKRTVDPYTDNVAAEIYTSPMQEHDAATISASISYQPGYTYTQYPNKKSPQGSNMPRFTLNYQKGVPNIANSISDYDKWSLQIQDRLNLKRWGSLSYNTTVGGFLSSKNVPIPDMNHLMGNQYTLAAPFLQSFQLAPYYRFSNTQKIYGTLHVEYYLKGLLTNKLPLFRQAHWYFLIGTNTFYTENNRYYTEAFIGLDNFGYKIFRIFRVDYVKGWDSEKRDYSGFRIGINTSNLLSTPKSTNASDF